ncbi:hypothetical protein D3C76_430790 [compost metagenome]
MQVFVLVEAVAEHRVGLAVVVGLAVGAAGATGLVDLTVEPGAGVAVVIGAEVDVFLHHLVTGLQVPDAVGIAAAHTGLGVVRQAHVELVVALVVVELDHVDLQALVAGDFVTGFIDGAGQALEASDHPIQGAQRLDLGHGQAQVWQVLWRRVQAEVGFAAKQLVGGEILFRRGELDAVGEGLAEGFFAVEGQDVEAGVEPARVSR